VSDDTQGADCAGKDCRHDAHAVGGPDEVDKERALFRAHNHDLSRQCSDLQRQLAEATGLLAEAVKHGEGAATKGFAAGMERAAVITENLGGPLIAQAIRRAATAAVPAPGDPPLTVTPAGLAALKRTRR
jgi:hypothetical protein